MKSLLKQLRPKCSPALAMMLNFDKFVGSVNDFSNNAIKIKGPRQSQDGGSMPLVYISRNDTGF